MNAQPPQEFSHYPAVPPTPPKQRSWFARHKILTALIGLVAIIAIVMAASGGGKSGDTSTPAASAPAGSGSVSSAAPAKAPGIGTPVRDGKFEFTVTKIESGKKTVGAQYLEQTAQGSYTLVHLTVKNIGDEAQSFSDSDQKLIGADDKQYSADSMAGSAIENNDVLFAQINPGNVVDGVLVFDLPAGAVAAKLELHDSPFSDGVTVALK